MVTSITLKRATPVKAGSPYLGSLGDANVEASIVDWQGQVAIRLQFDGAAKPAGHYPLRSGKLVDGDFVRGTTYIFDGKNGLTTFEFTLEWKSKSFPSSMKVVRTIVASKASRR
tara:strand:+ start:212 stop:553 length:342 start_codon:yes stop_codon:yes gene_type:complete